MFRESSRRALYLAGCATMLIGATALAQNQVIPYRGVLNFNGKPVSNPQNLRFTLYDEATAGAALWSEEWAALPVFAGQFSVSLGANTPFPADLFARSVVFLGIEVDTGGAGGPSYVALSGRQRLAPVPYALWQATGDRFRVAGELEVGGDVAVTGATSTASLSVGSSANVTGALTAGSANVSGALTAGSANVSGALTAGSLSVAGALSAGSVAGNLTVGGNLVVGVVQKQCSGNAPMECVCDPGTFVISGGAGCNMTNNYVLAQSWPQLSRNSWYGACRDRTTGADAPTAVSVFCARIR
ncbi:MAG: polymer-forming cytoskeletal protein [Deltaproteobacteria bacterium]|nr:polymer-forming cytoskeletal protein [Deltaproteobacteria bacterium]